MVLSKRHAIFGKTEIPRVVLFHKEGNQVLDIRNGSNFYAGDFFDEFIYRVDEPICLILPFHKQTRLDSMSGLEVIHQ